MSNNTSNNIILIIGLIIVALVPLSVAIFTTSLAQLLCVPQDLKGTEVCLPNGVPAFLITSSVPLTIGTVLIVISVLRRR